MLGDFHREEPLVNDVPEPVHDPRSIEVDARWAFVLQRVEGRALGQNVQRCAQRVPPDRLEERMSWRDPFQLPGLGRIAIGGAPRIAVREGRKLPVRLLLVAAQHRTASAPARKRAPGLARV